MSQTRVLSPDDHIELEKWMKTKQITLNHRTRRYLSDVVNMALLFKKVDSKLVNMKNYTSHGNLALKLHNWETFSLKVLRKTGLILMRPALELLATGDLNAIRSLLFHLMRMERDGIQFSSRRASPAKNHHLRQSSSQPMSQDDSGLLSPAGGEPMPLTDDELIGNQSAIHVAVADLLSQETPTQSKTDMAEHHDNNVPMSSNSRVSADNYEELKRMNEMKEQYIASLSQKVQYLENVIVDKEKRINQLLDHLSTLSVRIISMQTSLSDEALPPPEE